jgi:hypothetical protein
MFTLPGLLALLFDYYTRAHEIASSLRSLPIIHLLYLTTAFGLILDARVGLVRAEPCPQLRLAIPFWIWTLVSVVLTRGVLTHELSATTVYMMFFLLLAQGIQSFRLLRVVAISMLLISLLLGWVALEQARSPFQCIRLVASVPGDVAGRSDGRPCDSELDCREDDEPGEVYTCEKPGPLNTYSVAHGRVRYRGILQDPNELALALSIALPFAITMFVQRKTVLRLLLLLASFAIILPVVISTSSRTGQLAFIAVVAVYLIQRINWKSMLITAALVAPALLLGGRSGSSADESAMERLDAWSAGLEMFRSSPLWGIGKGQFTDHFYITAHNTFVLMAAELGLVGMILWVGVFYTGFKIVILGVRRYRDRPDGTVPYAWGRALLASLCGVAVGTSFLSLGYHPIIWAYLALPGAYYLAVRRHDPEFHVAFGVRDLMAVTGFAIVFLAGVKVYLIVRGV